MRVELQLSRFNSRSPSGLRPNATHHGLCIEMFQFTQPKRAATLSLCRCRLYLGSFNSRSPSGLRLPLIRPLSWWIGSFNSRSPSGLRLAHRLNQYIQLMFQFTQPKRAATSGPNQTIRDKEVSIHAAQAGCDMPHDAHLGVAFVFQFTQPKRAATS